MDQIARRPWTAGRLVLAVVGILAGIYIVARFGREFGIEGAGGAAAHPPRPTTVSAPPTSPTPATPAAPPPKDPHDAFEHILKTGAHTLWRDYDANEVKADATFKGKLVLVGGDVAAVDKDFLDNVIVRLKGPQMFTDVMAYPRKSETAKVTALSKGQKITVRCIGGGKTMNSPVLRDCVLP